jgi:hypothetical protein
MIRGFRALEMFCLRVGEGRRLAFCIHGALLGVSASGFGIFGILKLLVRAFVRIDDTISAPFPAWLRALSYSWFLTRMGWLFANACECFVSWGGFGDF